MASQNQQLITTLPDDKLCDFIDGTIRNDTPEEYVRQNIERRLVKKLGYKLEGSLRSFHNKTAQFGE